MADSQNVNEITIHNCLGTDEPTNSYEVPNWEMNSTSNTASTYNVRLQPSSTATAAGTDDCNESLKHTNTQKAVFHAVKGAHRLTDAHQHTEAAAIAGEAGKAFLQAEVEPYDSDRSDKYLLDKLVDEDQTDEQNIADAIERAFEKIDSGQHVGGARIAVSVADRYVEGFARPS